MVKRTTPETLPVGKLNAKPSASADDARRRAIARDLALTPRERVLKALSMQRPEKKDR